MNKFREKLTTEWTQWNTVPKWPGPIKFSVEDVPSELTMSLERQIDVRMILGVRVEIPETMDAVRGVKENVVKQLNAYFYRDFEDRLMNLVSLLYSGDLDRHGTCQELLKIMEDLR